jgi:anti-sigma B factor antagonist
MKYTIDKQEKYCIFKLNEEKLDSTLAPNFKSELITLNAEGVKNVILDLSEVRYSDSSGLSAFLIGNRLFTEAGGLFVLAGVNDHVLKLLSISQLDSVLNILPTVEEGVDAIFMNEIENELKGGETDNI